MEKEKLIFKIQYKYLILVTIFYNTKTNHDAKKKNNRKGKVKKFKRQVNWLGIPVNIDCKRPLDDLRVFFCRGKDAKTIKERKKSEEDT